VVYLLVIHAYINEMHGTVSKIPSKKISSGSVARRDLIMALKGLWRRNRVTNRKLYTAVRGTFHSGFSITQNLYNLKSAVRFSWLLYCYRGKGDLLGPILANVFGTIKTRSCRAKGRLELRAGKFLVSAIRCHVDCLGEACSLCSSTTALKRRHLAPSYAGTYTPNYTLPHLRKLESSSAKLRVSHSSPGSWVTNELV
jgi:hypothetical protein